MKVIDKLDSSFKLHMAIDDFQNILDKKSDHVIQFDFDATGSSRAVVHSAHSRNVVITKQCISLPSRGPDRVQILTTITDLITRKRITFDGTELSHARTALVALMMSQKYANPKNVLILGRGPIGKTIKKYLETYDPNVNITIVGKDFDGCFGGYNVVFSAITESELDPAWSLTRIFESGVKLVIDLTRWSIRQDASCYIVAADTKQLEWDKALKRMIEQCGSFHTMWANYKGPNNNIYVRLPGNVLWDLALYTVLETL